MGTYYYWGGGVRRAETNNNEPWTSHHKKADGTYREHFTMRPSHVAQADRYPIIWDQDIWRNYMQNRYDRMPHMQYRPGRSFGFYDGHVTFETYKGYDNASELGAYIAGQRQVRYKGTNYTNSTYTSGKIDGILHLPTAVATD
jgi:hypothetical protein